MLTRQEWIFMAVLFVNLVVAAAYLVWGIVVKCRKKHEGDIMTYVVRAVIMGIFPVAGVVYFLVVRALFFAVFRQRVDLEDVIFSKEKKETILKADEQRERDMAPLEEALAVSDKKNLRMLMMNVIKGDIQESLESVMQALNSEDSETSHYAASVLRDKLNEFRSTVQKLYSEMEKETDDQTECEEMLIDYMSTVLKQKVFKDLEQERFVTILNNTEDSLYRKNRAKMTTARYEYICQRLLDVHRYDDVRKWCDRIVEQYPQELASYTCRLKLYFTVGDRDNFLSVLGELRQSDVVIDSETLELIRVFS